MDFIATLIGLKCPHCGCEQLTVTGTKGALGASLATGAAFGAIGSIVAGKTAAANQETEPLQYKCSGCKKKFQALPLMAPMQDVLPAPCTVTFTRESSFVGAAVPQIVYINGVKQGAVKNGKSITFTTRNLHNIIYVTDQYGVAFKSEYRFEAQPGGNVSVRFKQKFLDSQNVPADIPANVPYMAPEMPAAALPQPSMKVQAAQLSMNAPAAQPYTNTPTSQPSGYVPGSEHSTQPQVHFCTNCGKTLADQDLFCPYCGTKRFS